MNMSMGAIGVAAWFIASLTAAAYATPLGTAFTYQGRLENPPGTPVDGVSCDFRFGLWKDDDSTLPADQMGTLQTAPMVDVTQGVFTTTVDFGAGSINGTARWLAVEVCCPSPCDPAFTLLAPRVEMTPSPHALALPGLFTQQNATSPNLIGGYAGNTVTIGAIGATVGGGGASGSANTVSGNYSTIGGGVGNTVSGDHSTVGGGINNMVSGFYSTVSGGKLNIVSGGDSTVGGGAENIASGGAATVPGGNLNRAGGDYSFAAGVRAIVRDEVEVGNNDGDSGTFVWADATFTPFVSTGPNQFLIRAGGGVGINRNNPFHPLHVGNNPSNGNGAHVTNGGMWTNGSDRNSKQGFEHIDKQDVLRKVAELSVTRWQYNGEAEEVRHIGPVAQDFYAAFGTGADDRFIGTIDADGVALAAIQGLYEIVQEKDCEIEELKAQASSVKQLEAKVAALEALMTQLAAQKNAGGQ